MSEQVYEDFEAAVSGLLHEQARLTHALMSIAHDRDKNGLPTTAARVAQTALDES